MSREQRKKRNAWRWAGALVCLLTLAVSIAILLSNRAADVQEDNEFQMLADQITEFEEHEDAQESARVVLQSPAPETALDVTVAATVAPLIVLPKYRDLYEKYPDFYGWIRIDDTKIDYPVMWKEDNPGFYLNHAFDGKKSNSGTPFIGAGFIDGADNAILYGHHMRSGTMFAGILDYEKKSFYLAHPLLKFDTIYQECTYEIFAAFRSKIYSSADQDAFRYYQYNGLQTEEAFSEFVEGCIGASMYDTGIVPVWGDKLVTLSTCSSHTQNGRFVVVARKIA